MEMRASFTLKHGEEIIAPCDCYLSNWSVGSVRCLPENVNLVLEGENVPFEVNKEISRGHRISCFVDIDKNRRDSVETRIELSSNRQAVD